jgi:hypothetical protein
MKHFPKKIYKNLSFNDRNHRRGDCAETKTKWALNKLWGCSRGTARRPPRFRSASLSKVSLPHFNVTCPLFVSKIDRKTSKRSFRHYRTVFVEITPGLIAGLAAFVRYCPPAYGRTISTGPSGGPTKKSRTIPRRRLTKGFPRSNNSEAVTRRSVLLSRRHFRELALLRPR